MLSKELNARAKSFLSELNNARHEYSFAHDDEWSLTECTQAKKVTIEKEFYPVLSVQCGFEDLPGFSNMVSSLVNKQPESDLTKSNPSKDRIFLVAYCLNKKA